MYEFVTREEEEEGRVERRGRNLWKISKSREVPFIPLEESGELEMRRGREDGESLNNREKGGRKFLVSGNMCIEERSNIVIWFFF